MRSVEQEWPREQQSSVLQRWIVKCGCEGASMGLCSDALDKSKLCTSGGI